VVIKHRYAAYYPTAETEIIVVRVLHGARDMEALSHAGGMTP
jgi:plasmid stabilization system protein ParE